MLGLLTINSYRPAELEYVDTFTVHVGLENEQKERFTIHTSVACQQSMVLNKLCAKADAEGNPKSFSLPDLDVEHFNIYMRYLYTGTVVIRTQEEAMKAKDGRKRQSQLIEMYLLGEAVDDMKLRNLTIDELIRFRVKDRVVMTVQRINIIFTKSKAGSKFRAYCIDCCIINATAESLNLTKSKLPPDFVFALLCGMTQARDNGWDVEPSFEDRCRYHEHDEWEARACEVVEN